MAQTPTGRRRRHGGFTLIELMVVLAIAGIALTLALPHFRQTIRHRQLIAETDAFVHAIQLTRSEAILRRQMVQMAPLDGRDWARGWCVYRGGATGNGGYREGDPVLLRHDSMPVGIRTESHGDPSAIYIAYNGEGRSIRRDRLRLAGHWRLRAGRESRVVIINLQGRVRICNPAVERRGCDV